MKNKVFFKPLVLGLLFTVLLACNSCNGMIPDEIMDDDNDSYYSGVPSILPAATSSDEALADDSNSDAGSETDAMSSQPDSDSIYEEAIEAYKRVLLGEQLAVGIEQHVEHDDKGRSTRTFRDQGEDINIIYRLKVGAAYTLGADDEVLYSSRFALFDITGDGIPELILDSVACTYYHENDADTVLHFQTNLVLTYKYGEVVFLYGMGNRYHRLEVLDNRILLVYGKNGDSSYMQYYYYDFDGDGNCQLIFSCEERLDYDDMKDYGNYYGVVENNFVTREVYEKLTVQYFSLEYGMIGWNDLETWINDRANVLWIISE